MKYKDHDEAVGWVNCTLLTLSSLVLKCTLKYRALNHVHYAAWILDTTQPLPTHVHRFQTYSLNYAKVSCKIFLFKFCVN